MRILLAVLLSFSANVFAAEPTEEKAVLAGVQKLFDAMAAHDADMARSSALPEARYVATRENGTVTSGSMEQFAARLITRKEAMLERMWSPKVLIRGRIATVWAEYDFHLDKKFTHCGIDSLSLVKTAEGWKISAIAYTVETTGCPVSPLGPA